MLAALREGPRGSLGVLEANESVTTAGVVLVQGNLGADNVTVFLEFLFKTLGLKLLGDLSDKDVLLVKAINIGTQQLRVVGQSTAWLALQSEEAQLLSNFVELVGVLNLDDSGVEGLAGVTTNLGHVLERVAGLVLDDLCELG